MSDPYLGRTFGNVVLEAKIGQGGMGMVYRGRHTRMDKTVAVKLLPPQHNDDQGHYQKRFLREGRTSAAIQHRHVVQVMDAGKDGDIAYLVLEYVQGRNLGEILDRDGAMPPTEAERLALGIAEGLGAIHGKGVVHRDIKPDNLLLSPDGLVKITDLGLARQLNDPEVNRLTATGMVVGTPLYVAPEAIRDNKTAGAPSDVYSFGASLYHMLTGEPPFLGRTPYDVMRGHLERRPPPVREHDKAIPKHLANLVHLCLAKDPVERPTPGEIVRILRSRRTVHAGGNRTTTMLGIAAVVAVVAIAVLAWQLLGGHHRGLVEAADSTAIAVDLPELTRARIRIGEGDDATWRSLDDAPVRVPPGTHAVVIEGHRDGRLLRWNDTVRVAAGATTAVRADPRPVPVADRAVHLTAGDGVVFVEGVARGEDATVVFDELGTFAVTRFDGRTAWNTRVRVTPGGIDHDPVRRSARPDPAAYLSDHVAGQTVPPHHLLVWSEAEHARRAAEVPPPMNWRRGESRRTEPAIGLDLALVTAVREWAAGLELTLPDRATARTLSDAHGAPIWYQEDGRIRHWGGGASGNALLLLLPRR